MKRWDFFYDEPKQKPYNQLDDWVKEIKYLLWPALILFLLLGLILSFL